METAPKRPKLRIADIDVLPIQASAERTAGSGERIDTPEVDEEKTTRKRVERTDGKKSGLMEELKEAIPGFGEKKKEGNPQALEQLPGHGGLIHVGIGKLKESPTNPRKTFAKMEHLTASIKAAGLLVPLIVRPHGSEYEIVAGHRRFRAAKAAGLKGVLCDVRALDDAQVLEIQITENLQREDLTELEEAETFESLREIHHYTVEQIAAKIGASRATVYGRLKLLALCPEARKAVGDGVLPASVAVPLARLPGHKLQASALKSMIDRFTTDGVIVARQAIEFLQRDFCRSLKGVPFSLKDDSLFPEAGACTTCPKNSANATPGLFDDLKTGQTCTDVSCFDQKTKANWKRKAEREESKGAVVLSIDEGGKLYQYGSLGYQTRYVELEAKNHADPKKRTWGELLEAAGEAGPPRVVAPDKSLAPRNLVDREALVKALAESKGYKWAEAEVDRTTSVKEESPKHREQREAEEAREAAMGMAVSKAAAVYARTVKDDPVWKLMAIGLSQSFTTKEVLEALGWEDSGKIEDGKAPLAECVRFVIVKTLLADRDADYSEGYPAALKQWTRSMGADVGAIFDAQQATAAAEELMKGKKKGKS